METMINNATLVPSVVADGSEVADSSYLAVVVAASILALLFIGAMLALLIYRYYKRTSGPVWIHSKVKEIDFTSASVGSMVPGVPCVDRLNWG